MCTTGIPYPHQVKLGVPPPNPAPPVLAPPVRTPAPAPPAGMDLVEIWCSSYQAGGITTSYDHCDVRCIHSTGEVLIGGGTGRKIASVVDGGGPGGNGYPNWVTKDDLAWGASGLVLAATTAVPSGTCRCISGKGNRINMIKGKHYDLPGDSDGNVSNSNSLLSTLLKCCNAGPPSLALPAGRAAPGWGDDVEYRCGCRPRYGKKTYDSPWTTAENWEDPVYCRIGCDDINAVPKQPRGAQ
jgi:hypothetical protein